MSRRIALSFITPLLLLVAAPPALAATMAPVQLDGTLEFLHGEDFDTGASTFEYRLHTATETVRLTFDGDAPAGFVNGARVRIHGHRSGLAAVAADGGITAGTVLASAPGWSGQRRIAVAMINFSNNASKPFTRSYVNGVLFANPNSVRAYYAEESGGAVQLTGTVFDWMRIPVSNATCDTHAFETYGRAALAARGVDLSAYTNVMFVFPQSDACHWRGMAYLPGPTSWINGAPTLRTTAHELAHNFGVHHASSLRCTANGVRVALSASCTRSEYGDPFTVMGAAPQRHDQTLARVQLGYLPASATRTITASGTYTMTKSFSSSGVRVIGIPRGNGTWFYLDYRRPYGTYFDNYSTTSGAVTGVTIRLAQGWTTITQTSLIDTVPSTTTFADAPLKLGRTFKDYLTGITITVSALTSGLATVTIKLPPDTVAPGAPGSPHATAASLDSVSLAWTAATDNRAVTGYRVSRAGAPTITLPASSLAWTATGLAPATTYTWTVQAIDGAGNASPAASVTVATLTPDAPPSAVTGLAATTTQSSARLSWGAATDDHGVTGYAISQDGLPIGTTSARSFSVTGLEAGTTYTWTVRAIDTVNQLGAAATVTATTPCRDVTPPTAVQAWIGQDNHGHANLTWSAATDDVGVVAYRIYRDGSLLVTVDAATRSYRVSTGAAYSITAVDLAGNESPATPAQPA